ncbi:MAG: FG-GAP-like repeat-containing protein, partial [Pseudomonadota bacterium]
MTKIFSGNTIGLLNSSIEQLNHSQGKATVGQFGDRSYVNVQNGNLVIQRNDAIIVGQGIDAQILRTYNSQGYFWDDNFDNWQINTAFLQNYNESTVNQVGHQITRFNQDGAKQFFVYDEKNQVYMSELGQGAYDTLILNTNDPNISAIFTDGSSGIQELYNAEGRISQTIDPDGHITTYSYDINNSRFLSKIMTSNNEVIDIIYNYDIEAPEKIIRRTYADSDLTNLINQSSTYYRYNNYRLSEVIVDLTPEDNDISDQQVYSTTYEYLSEWSNLVSSIKNSDGTQVNFEYDTTTKRIKTIIDGEGRRTSISYDVANNKATVLSPEGVSTQYIHDDNGLLKEILVGPVNGQLLQTKYSYDKKGNLTFKQDPSGREFSYSYDSNGNLIYAENDGANGNTTYTYSDDNLLLVKEVYAGNGSHFERYVYDEERHLRFIINAEGEVTENRYSSSGNLISERRYTQERFPMTSATERDVLAESQLIAWVNQHNAANVELTEYEYDFRGQLIESTTFAQINADGQGSEAIAKTTYVYDSRGQLLKTINATGNATPTVEDGVTTFVYDGMNRLLSRINVDGQASTHFYDDANRQMISQSISGLITTQFFDASGRVISSVETVASDASKILGSVTYTYNSDGNLAVKTDAYGVRSYTFYDDAGRVQATVDGTGAVIEYIRTPSGEVEIQKRYVTRVNTQNWYDATNNQVLQKDFAAIRPAAHSKDRVNETYYDEGGRKYYEYDAEFSGKEYIYDNAHRLIKTIQYSNETTNLENLDRTERYFYDKEDRLIGVLDAEGYFSTRAYNAAGRLIEEVVYANQVDEILRDSGTFKQLLANTGTSNDNRIERHLYNARGEKIASMDGEGYVTHFTYDSEGRLTETKRFANALPPRNLYYTGETKQFTGFGPNAGGWSNNNTYPRTTGDVNGDGLADLVGFASNGVHVALANSDGTYTTSSVWIEQYGTQRGGWVSFDQYPRLLADVNGDGMDDIVGFGNTSTYVSLSNGNGFDPHQTWSTEFDYSSEGTFTQSPRWVGDLDGDGKDEVIIYRDNAIWAMRTNSTNNGFSNPRQVAVVQNTDEHNFYSYDDHPSFFGDVNGDGKDDLVHFGYETTWVRLSSGNQLGEYQDWKALDFASLDSEGYANYQFDEPRTLADINGDGLMDAVAFLKDGTYVAYSKGHEFSEPELIVYGFAVEEGGWSNNNIYPRMAADYTGDGRADIIGFANDGVYSATLIDPQDYSYNINDWLPEASEKDQTETFQYDIAGRLIKKTNVYGDEILYEYDAQGRLVKEIKGITHEQSEQLVAHYAYDEKNRVIESLDGVKATQIESASDSAFKGIVTAFGTRHEYDKAGRLINTTTDKLHNISYYYDAMGRVSHIQNEDQITENIYNAFGEISQKRVYATPYTASRKGGFIGDFPELLEALTALKNEKTDSFTTYEYDRLGQLTKLGEAYRWDLLVNNDTNLSRPIALLAYTTHQYNDFGERIYTEKNYDHGGFVKQISHLTYDKRGLLLEESISGTNAEQTKKTWEYNAFQELAKEKENLQERFFEYDKRGFLVKEKNNFGIIQNQYDAFGRKLSLRDANNHVTLYSYDDKERATTITTAEGFSTTTQINQHGQKLGITDAEGNITHYYYDANGQLIDTTFNGQSIAFNDVDGYGRTLLAYDGNFNGTQYKYDAKGRVFEKIIDPDGLALKTQYIYDANGRVIKEINAEGIITEFEYNHLGYQTKIVVDANGLKETTTLDYDAAGNVTARYEFIDDAKTRTTQYQYDGRGNLIRETLLTEEGVQTTEYEYDSRNNLHSVTNALGHQSFSFYDELNRKVFDIDASGAVMSYGYDAKGNLVSEVSYRKRIATSSLTKNSTVNFVSSLIGYDVAVDRTTLYRYDKDDRVKFTLNVASSSSVYVTENKYDDINRLVETIRYATPYPIDFTSFSTISNRERIKTSPSTSDIASNLIQNAKFDRREGYVYDAQGNKAYTLEAVMSGTGLLANLTKFEYDAAQRLVSETQYEQQVPYIISTFENTQALLAPYNLEVFSGNRTTAYTYDNANRLKTMTDALGHQESYEYDKMGRREALIDKNGNRFTYQYDAMGRVTHETSPPVDVFYYNQTGTRLKTTRSIVKHYTYDALGQVTAITEDFGGNMEHTQFFEYDAAGNQILIREENPGVLRTGTYQAQRLGNERITRTTYNATNQAVVNQNTLGDYRYRIYNSIGQVVYDIDEENYVTYFEYNTHGEQIQLTRLFTALNLDALKSLGWEEGKEITLTLLEQALQANPIQPAIIFNDVVDRDIFTEYDKLGRKVSVKKNEMTGFDSYSKTNYQGTPETRYEYNAFGDVIKESHFRGVINGVDKWTSQFRLYDNLGREVLVSDHLGFVTATHYDAMGQVTRKAEYAESQYLYLGADVDVWRESILNTLLNKINPNDKDRHFEFTYDALGRQRSQTFKNATYYKDSNQVTSDLTAFTEYDKVGNITKTIDNQGNAASFEYDALNRKTFAKDVERKEYAFIMLDSSLTGTEASFAPTHFWQYDSRGNIIGEIHVANDGTDQRQEISHIYDYAGRHIQSEQSYRDFDGEQRNKVINIAYDLADRKVVETLQIDTQYQFWQNRSKDTHTRVSTYTYDKRGLLTKTLNLDDKNYDHHQSQKFNAFGEMVERDTYYEASNDDNIIEYFFYDRSGNFFSSNQNDGVFTYYDYDMMGNVTHEYQKDGGNIRETFKRYNELNQLIKIEHPWFDGYANNGNDFTTLKPEDFMGYDRWGNLIYTRNSKANYHYYEYNHADQIIHSESPEVKVTGFGTFSDATTHNRFGYDSLGHQVYSEDANQNASYRLFNAAGNLRLERNAENNITYYASNGFNQEVGKQKAATQGQFKRYDAMGNVTQIGILKNKAENDFTITTSYRYNAAGERTHEIRGHVENSDNVSYTDYSLLGNVEARWSEKSGLYTSTIQGLSGGFLFQTETDANGNVTKTAFDNYGRVTQKTFEKTDGTVTKRLNFAYDNLGQLQKEILRGPDPSFILSEKRYTYWNNGQLKAVAKGRFIDTILDTERAAASSIRTVADKNVYLLEAMRTTNAEWEYVQNTTIYYDTLGLETMVSESIQKTRKTNNAVEIENIEGLRMRHSYDAQNRLIDSRDALTRKDDFHRVTYAYDAVGNRMQINYLTGEYDYQTLYFSYDKANRIKVNSGLLTQGDVIVSTQQFAIDKDNTGGELRSGRSSETTYDSSGRKYTVKTYVGQRYFGNQQYEEFRIERYTYDAFDRIKTIDVRFDAENIANKTSNSLKLGRNINAQPSTDWSRLEEHNYNLHNNTGYAGELASIVTFETGYNDDLAWDESIVGREKTRNRYYYEANGRKKNDILDSWSKDLNGGRGDWYASAHSYDYEYDALGQVLSYISQTQRVESGQAVDNYQAKQTHVLEFRGGYQEVATEVKTLQGRFEDVRLNTVYGSWGNVLSSQYQDGDAVKTRYFDYSAQDA